MTSVLTGPGMLTLQLAIFLLTLIQTIGVVIIIWKLNLGLKDFFSLSSPIKRSPEKQPFYDGV